jgi:hypothetical protein
MRTADLCESCPKTHYLAENICIAYTRDLCAEFNEQKDLCESCIEGKAWLSHGICEEYTISHCEEYNPQADECVECEKGNYFLSEDKTCKMTTPVENCKVYRNDVDECSECEDQFYLIEDNICRPNPNGFYKCVAYASDTECSECEFGFYLKNGQCERSSTSINNCTKYSDEAVCETCEANYLLVDYVAPTENTEENTEETTETDQVETDDGITFTGLNVPAKVCKAVVETSCSTWQDLNNCATCGLNQILKKNTETEFMVCEDSQFENCKVAELDANDVVTCNECVAGYLLKKNEEDVFACVSPSILIDGCADYETEGICRLCSEGRTLAASRTGCIASYPLMSANCLIGQEFASPVCKVCNDGYHLNDSGECVTCGGTGCAVCDPYDAQMCVACLPSHEHVDGVCEPVGGIEESTDPQRFASKSTMILTHISVLAVLMTIVNRF